MADEVDLEALRSGDADLVRRDFRSAKLSGLPFSSRDFSHAHLEFADLSGADLSESNFEGAHLMQLNVEGANLSSTNWRGSIYAVNFRGADLRRSKLEQCVLNKCDLRNADLRGASFRKSTIQEETQFDGALVDEATMFDGVKILRAISRQEAFRYYEVDRGALRRVPEGAERQEKNSASGVRSKLIAQIEALQADLRRLEPPSDALPNAPGLGHNNPPVETPVDRAEHGAILQALTELKTQVAAAEPEPAKVAEATSLLKGAGAKVLRWAAVHVDAAAGEFAKGLGKNLSDPLKMAAAWTLVAGGLAEITHAVRVLFGF